MRRILLLLLSLVLVACHAHGPIASAPTPVGSAALEQRPLFGGTVVPTGDAYGTQAIATNLQSSSIVSLIDPTTSNVQGTGLTNASGAFTVTALPTFTPTLNSLYLLQVSKPQGGVGNGSFALRTMVQLTPTGWTSISGTPIVISTMTTAVALFYTYKGLQASDVIGKVTFDPTTRRSIANALTSVISEVDVRQAEGQVQQALGLNLDPMQAIHPLLNGAFGISLATSSANMLVNPSFELGGGALTGWGVAGVNPTVLTFSPDTTTAFDRGRSAKTVTSAAGDAWFGQGPQGGISTPLTFVQGQTYTFSVWAKGAAGTEKISLRAGGGLPGFLEIGTTIVTLTTSWQRYSYTFVAPSSTAQGVAFIRTSNLTGIAYPQTVWFDAAQVEVGATASAYAPPPSRLVYDSTTTPGFGSSGYTYTAGYNGGTGLVLDSGLNLVQNGHAQNGTANYSVYGGSLTTTTAYGTPPNCPNATVFQLTHTAVVQNEYPYQTITVQPNTTYTVSSWVYFTNPSTAWSFGAGSTMGAINLGALNGGTATAGVWTRLVATFNSGANTSVVAFPIDTPTANSIVAFTMVQVEPGTVAHPYVGGSTLDRYTLDPRYVPRDAGTIEYWFSPFYDATDTRWNDPIGMLGISNGSDDAVLVFSKVSNNRLSFGIQDGTTWQRAVSQSSTPPLWTAGSWHHVAMTWGAASGMALYFDGKLLVSLPYKGGIYNTDPTHAAIPMGCLYLSGFSHNSTYVHNATIDQFRIYDGPRSPQEIARDYLGIQPTTGY